MNTLIAKVAMTDILSAAKLLVAKAQQIGDVISRAEKENRDVTEAEMDSIVQENEAVKIAVHAAVLNHIGRH